MPVEIITKEDLQEFKREFLHDLVKIIRPENQDLGSKKWLKSAEVRKLLKISPGTLQTLRVNGTLSFTKVGATLYYDQEDINKVLESNKVQNR